MNDTPALKPVPEAVILDLQASVYEHRKTCESARSKVQAKEAELAAAQNMLRVEERALREVVEFLAEHNSGACDWWAEMGLTPKS